MTDGDTPRPAGSCRLATVDDGLLVLPPGQSGGVVLDPVAALVWRVCDGRRSISGIRSMLQAAYPDAAARVVEDLAATLEQLVAAGALELADRPVADPPLAAPGNRYERPDAMGNLYFLCPQRAFMFLSISKNACTSLKHLLYVQEHDRAYVPVKGRGIHERRAGSLLGIKTPERRLDRRSPGRMASDRPLSPGRPSAQGAQTDPVGAR